MKLFCKVDVNGDKEHPLFTFLKVLKKEPYILNYVKCLHNIIIYKTGEMP